MIVVMIPSRPNRDTSPLLFIMPIKAMVTGNVAFETFNVGGLNLSRCWIFCVDEKPDDHGQ